MVSSTFPFVLLYFILFVYIVSFFIYLTFVSPFYLFCIPSIFLIFVWTFSCILCPFSLSINPLFIPSICHCYVCVLYTFLYALYTLFSIQFLHSLSPLPISIFSVHSTCPVLFVSSPSIPFQRLCGKGATRVRTLVCNRLWINETKEDVLVTGEKVYTRIQRKNEWLVGVGIY